MKSESSTLRCLVLCFGVLLGASCLPACGSVEGSEDEDVEANEPVTGTAPPGDRTQYGGGTDYDDDWGASVLRPDHRVCGGACQNGGELNKCTCGKDDPCGWAGDGRCDARCAEFSAEPFDDKGDCE